MMRLKSTTHSTDQNQRSAASSLSSITNSGVWRSSGQVHCDHKCRLFVHFEGFTQVRVHPLGQSCRVRWNTQKKKIIKNQRLFPCGKRLQDVAASLQQGFEHPSELPMIGIVRHKIKWYSHNNRRLWCFKEAKMEAVEVCMSSVDTAFLHSVTTQTDSLSVTFCPPVQCKECAKEFVNRKGLRRHKLCSHTCAREKELPQQPLLRNSTTVTFVT